jgi:hypothetical protein
VRGEIQFLKAGFAGSMFFGRLAIENSRNRIQPRTPFAFRSVRDGCEEFWQLLLVIEKPPFPSYAISF